MSLLTCPRPQCAEVCYPDETRCPECGALLGLSETLLDAVRAPDLPTPPKAVRLARSMELRREHIA